jgi:hypothetical protein
MANRLSGKTVAVNSDPIYSDTFKARGVPFIKQYITQKLTYPTAEEMADIQEIGVVWGVGDHLWKLAQKYYGDPELWYIIAFWNRTHEFNIVVGQTVYIPTPLSRVLSIIEV